MNTWTLILTAHLHIVYNHGGELTRNIHEEFHAPADVQSCEVFKSSRHLEFIGEAVTPLLMKGLEVTAQVETTCVQSDGKKS